MVVIDASAAVDLVLAEERSRKIASLIESEDSLAAPEIIVLEVIHTLRRLSRSGEVRVTRAEQARSDFTTLPISLYRHTPFSDRVWELRDNFGAYDGAYVALAEGLEAGLITCDARLARGLAGSGLPVTCELVR